MAADKWSMGMGALAVLSLPACVQLGPIPNPFGTGGGHIHLDSHPVPGASVIRRNGQPVTLLLGDVSDGRQGSPARKVGEIRSTVIDMTSSTLVLDQEVSTQLFTSLKDQLAADGFRMVADSHASHDFELDAVDRDFRLDIADQDSLTIDVDLKLRDAKTGDVLWAGSVAEKSSRFAGVAGNSHSSIVSYFNFGLGAWAVKASAEVRDSLMRSYPQTLTLGERQRDYPSQSIDGVITRQEAKPHEVPGMTPPPTPAAVAPAPGAAPAVSTRAPAAVTAAAVAPVGKGMFSVTTAPTKAKVYGDDVYYGTSPLTLALDPGVTVFRFTLDGYKTVTQKVSIRRGETTELEVKFEK